MIDGITNVTLAEVDILNKKLESIKDIINDTLLNDPSVSDFIDAFIHIKAICDKRTCDTCEYWQQEDITDGMVCVNADSDNVTEWTDSNNYCKAHTPRKEMKNEK